MEVRNRFKGLDLIDRVPDELWIEVCYTVQETGIKTIPKEKEMPKSKMADNFSDYCLKANIIKAKNMKNKFPRQNYSLAKA